MLPCGCFSFKNVTVIEIRQSEAQMTAQLSITGENRGLVTLTVITRTVIGFMKNKNHIKSLFKNCLYEQIQPGVFSEFRQGLVEVTFAKSQQCISELGYK